MKRTICIYLLWGWMMCPALLQAQTAMDKGLKSINRTSAEVIVGFLADDELQGREAGTRDSRIVARYLASCLKEAGIAP